MQRDDTSLLAVRQVRAAWELFVSGEERHLDYVRADIKDSWRRSQRLGVSPLLKRAPVILDPEEFDRCCQRNVNLLQAGRLVFTLLTKALTRDRYTIVITDETGRVLYNFATPKAREWIEVVNGLPRSGWSEALAGTNSVGVALHLDKPAQVHWFEHYAASQHELAGCAAPIHRSDGVIIGSIAMSGHREIAHPRALELVITAAQTIEERLHAQEAVWRTTILEAFYRHLLRYPDEALLALDPYGQIIAISPNVQKLTAGFSPDSLIGRNLTDLTPLSPFARIDDVYRQSPTVFIQFGRREKEFEGTLLPFETTAGQRSALLRIARSRQFHLRRTTAQPWASTYSFSDLVGQAPAFRHAVDLARKVAKWNNSALLIGESGTGKELFAQAIHHAGSTARGPFMALNCSAIPRDLAAAELFGYEEGTFTGARRGGRKGKIELADGGTLFLDEVGDLPLDVQPTLLRFLEDGQILALGSERPRQVAVRIVAAAGSGLAQAVASGAFRLDLYHRLSFFTVTLPPLRERLEDIPLLARHFLDSQGFPHIRLSPQAVALLLQHPWPGNVRELQNVIVRAAMLAESNTLFPADLTLTPVVVQPPPTARRLPPTTEEIQREMETCGGNASQAARNLGIHRVTLYRRLRARGR
jgi:PAS domain S-box-containing protein